MDGSKCDSFTYVLEGHPNDVVVETISSGSDVTNSVGRSVTQKKLYWADSKLDKITVVQMEIQTLIEYERTEIFLNQTK